MLLRFAPISYALSGVRGGDSRPGLAGDAGHQSPGISRMPVGIDLKKASGGVVGVEVVGGGPGVCRGPKVPAAR